MPPTPTIVKHHRLKTWPECFAAISLGDKLFDLRKNDRDFHVGDRVILKEFIPCPTCAGRGCVWQDCTARRCIDCNEDHGQFTGNDILATITYLLKPEDGFRGLEDGFCILGIRKEL